EASALLAADPDDPEDVLSPEHGDRDHRAEAAQAGVLVEPWAPAGIAVHVDHVLDGPAQHDSLLGPTLAWAPRLAHVLGEGPAASRKAAARRGQPDQLAVVAEDRHRPGLEQPHGAVRDDLEDRLDVGLRLTDGAQDLRGGRLAVEGLREVVVPRVQRREEIRV